MARFMKQRRRVWYFNLRIPEELRQHFGGKQKLEPSLGTRDQKIAQAKANGLASKYHMKFEALRGNGEAKREIAVADVYHEMRQRAPDIQAEGESFVPDVEYEDKFLPLSVALDGLRDEAEKRGWNQGDPLPPDIKARRDAINDARAELAGETVTPRIKYEPSFAKMSDRWLGDWKADNGGKGTNTLSQYESTIRLFKDYWGDRPVREISRRDATTFIDDLARFDPNWGRSPKTKEKSFQSLKKAYMDSDKRLSASTLNRHIRVMMSIWEYAEIRDLADGRNPFRKLTKKAKHLPYLPWEKDELKALLNPPPKRGDLHELILVAMYGAMRINEIASLTWDDLKEEDGIIYFDITAAKTEAGIRQVPVHSALGWLLKKTRGKAGDRIWPDFNDEGAGGKPGEDASKLFGDHKRDRGFTDRQKVFHSFRKNTTKIMERKGVPMNEWQEVFGHEKGFTWRVYNPDGITLERKQEIVELIEYKGLEVPI